MATAPKPFAALSAGLLAREGRAPTPLSPAIPSEAAAPHRAPMARTTGDKAAFTLRLDAERRLRLRLAAAVTGRSARQLVTEAIDTMLADLAALELPVRQSDAGEE